ncbi:MAG: copper-translocating P-type ATPase, partial [Eubacteriales bacterium]|nr:copper-translocating P-type ATPase [Eubacteriales bacterium]
DVESADSEQDSPVAELEAKAEAEVEAEAESAFEIPEAEAEQAAAEDAEDSSGTESTAIDAETKAAHDLIDRQAEAERKRKKELHDPLAQEQKVLKDRLIYSFILLIPLVYFMLEMIPGLNLPLPSFMQGDAGAANRAFTQLLFTVPVLFLNRSFFSSGTKALIKRHPNMDSLVAIGAGSAFAYGVFTIFKLNWGLMINDASILATYAHQLYLDSAAMIVTLISLGKYFELRAKRKTTTAVESLLELAPAACNVLRDGEEIRLPAAEVPAGSEIILRPGERVALDGEIIEGRSAFDEQALSGESLPVDKEVGDKIFAGTVNQNGVIIYRSLKPAHDTILARIVNMVEDAAASKAEIARLADRVAAIFVPVVLAIAVLTFIVWRLSRGEFEWAMNMAVSVLLISCPCALGLATPVAMMVASGRAAQEGILIKGADSLERINDVTDLVMDKTGTVTLGKPEIVEIQPHPASGLSERDLLELAASIESGSDHPLAKAVLQKAEEVGLKAWPQEDGQALPGRGVFARIYGHNYFAGNLALLAEAGLSSEEVELLTEREAEQGRSALLIFSEDQFLGLLSASDQIKDEARSTLHSLRQRGLDLLLLTGDHKEAAKSIGRRLDLSESSIVAEVLPHEKAEIIRERQADKKIVAMLGDGINDAPALVTADLGIAVGAGTDIALESADVVLMHSDLRDVLTFFELGKKTLKVMKQNLFWAFFYNVIGIPLAAGVFYPAFGWKLNPIYAALAMSLSSIFVVTNALRLKRFVPSWRKHEEQIEAASTTRSLLDSPGSKELKSKKLNGKFLEARAPETQILEGVVSGEKYSAELTAEELAQLAESEAEA